MHTLKGHKDRINRVSFSLDSNRVVSSGDDGVVKVWDATSGSELQTFPGHTGGVHSAAFSPDGTLIVSAGKDMTIKVWDATINIAPPKPAVHDTMVQGSTIFYGSDFTIGAWTTSANLKDIKLWDVATGKVLFNLVGHTGIISSVAFNFNGSRLVSEGQDKTLRIWDTRTGAQLCVFARYSGAIASVAFSPDGTRVVSANNNTIHIWDTITGKELFTLNGHLRDVCSVVYSSSGRFILSAAFDGIVRLWDSDTGREVRSFAGHVGGVCCARFNSDSSQIVSSGIDNTIIVWDTHSGLELVRLYGHTGYVAAAAFSPTNLRITSASADDTLKLWDSISGLELLTIGSEDWSNKFNTKVFKHDHLGMKLINPKFSAINLRDPFNYDEKLYHVKPMTVDSVASTADGTLIVGRSLALIYAVWSLTTGQLLEDEPVPEGLTYVTRADLPDGKREAFIQDGKIVVRDKAKYAAFQAEMGRRLAEYAKPKPDWHARQFDEAVAAKNAFAAKFHLGYLRKIKGDGDPAVTAREKLVPPDAKP